MKRTRIFGQAVTALVLQQYPATRVVIHAPALFHDDREPAPIASRTVRPAASTQFGSIVA